MRPTLLLPLLCIGWALLGVACSVGLLPADIWWASGAALVLVSLLDAWRVRRYAVPDVVRDLPDALPVGVQRTVLLSLDNGPRKLRVDVHDLHPNAWAIEGLPRTLQPVSYTHLDVYKRQGNKRPTKPRYRSGCPSRRICTNPNAWRSTCRGKRRIKNFVMARNLI